MIKKIRDRGMTLIEVLLVVGLLGGMVALAIPFYQSFQVTSELDNTTHEIISALRLAQGRAMASENFEAHGVHFEAVNFTVFSGDQYDANDPENFTTETSRTLSINAETTDLIFARITGRPEVASQVIISANSGEQRLISINELGVVNEQ
jgi:prepilin-type N-terminal cleavage/methylation domain-containing protein